MGVLASALVGGGLVAGHSEAGDDTVHIEELALQAFTTSSDDTGPAVTLEPAMPTAPSTGSARAVSEPPPPIDVDAIIGAADGAVGDALAAQRQRAEERSAADRPDGDDLASSDGGGPAGCAAGAEGFGAVASSVATAGEKLRCMFGIDTVYGVAGRSNASDHPKGNALDFMVDQATGEKLAAYARQNSDELGISYVIYRQRIDTGSGWESMEDRGGITANHMDHVHISFD
ncbi:hypothetical protein SAMN05216207_11211 [Pseudonocardia ammonioxydans]|uniref:ARB-07466-like C-terminal domain-containing protein n=1 Tax=Pseudonocardia ammonioxydans TaxID=260086 RepID=A0A1I5IQT4_PSUAM|nr:hypothetical protein SAMN05216207_11211 [Pseudonocardia ammonioxydans]